MLVTDPSPRLSPAELAEAAVLADLAVVAVLLARLSPFAGFTTVIGAIPFAVLGLRRGTRTVVVSFFVAVILVFLLAGFSASTQVIVMAVLGGLVGRGIASGWSRTRMVLTAVGIGWTIVASLTVVFLWMFAGLRELNLEAARVQWTGISRGLNAIGLDAFVDVVDPRIDWIIQHWYISIPAFQLVISFFVTGFIVRVGRPVVGRVQRAFGDRPPPSAALTELAQQLASTPGLTVVTGPNGVGKSTLLRAMAGNAGGLGQSGGTAVIGQRPESQVIGVRVDDDLAWGMTQRPLLAERSAALELVGLTGFEERETGSLSGGELQRLALASAVLRTPRLLLSDESTAMIDPAGRTIVLDVLRRLADGGVTVVHASHLDADAAIADRVVEL